MKGMKWVFSEEFKCIPYDDLRKKKKLTFFFFSP